MSWIQNAKVGDKIVCVDADGTRSVINLIAGRVYVIREILCWKGNVGVRLEDIINKMHPDGEYGYLASRFRPVHPRKTDISIFEKLLQSAPADQPVKEPAPC